jgi:polar amino acid transport system permease protein/polar amino acid transport system substrate-binding protein
MILLRHGKIRSLLPFDDASVRPYPLHAIIFHCSRSINTCAIKARGVLLWGSDSEGGAPYVFPDPKDPSKLIGFELDIVEAIAKQLGVKAQLVQTAWDSLIPALERGDYDIAMNGREIIPEREKRVLFSRPYYVYTLQLMVRKDEYRIKNIHDLPGKKVGTLACAVAQDMLTNIGVVDIWSYSAA